MKYKESVQSSGSNNNTYNLRVPGSGTKMSSHVTVQAASVSGISGDINVNLMTMFNNSQKKNKEKENSDSDSDRMDQNCDESYKGDDNQINSHSSAIIRGNNNENSTSTIGNIMQYFRKGETVV